MEMTLENAGTLNLSIDVKNGEEVIATAEEAFDITRDDSRSTVISTAAEFISLITKSGTSVERYMLGANIDLGGYVHDGKAVNATFNGVLDGNGYTVSNFVEQPAGGVDGGLFFILPKAVIRNIHLIGSVNASGGWSGLLAKEIGAKTVIIDSIFEATDLTPIDYDSMDWTWQRNGVIAGFLTGHVENVVSVKYSDNDRMISTFPYSNGDRRNENAMATMKNVYTNIESENLTIPFGPDPGWSSAALVIDLHRGLGDFSETKASDFALDEAIFTLADGQMPVLKHHGEAPVVLSPEVKLEVSKKSIVLEDGASATITASLVNSEETPVWSFEVKDEAILEASLVDNVITLTPKSVGVSKVIVTATVGEVKYQAEVEITVKEESAGGSYEIPENAVLISNVDEFKAFFNGSAENTDKNAALTADIDLGGETRGLGMAGDYSGIFEGQGYSITNYTGGAALFNFLTSTGVIRNVNFELTNTGSGQGVVVYGNNGLVENVTVKVTISSGVNTFGGISLTGTGAFVDCHVDWVLASGSESSNTLYPIVQDDAGKTIENCTYTVDGDAGKFMTSNPNVTKE